MFWYIAIPLIVFAVYLAVLSRRLDQKKYANAQEDASLHNKRASLKEYEESLSKKKKALDAQEQKIAADLQTLQKLKVTLNKKAKELHEKELHLQEGAFQYFLDFVTDSVLTRDYLLDTPAFQALVDPEFTIKRYSISIRNMESEIWIESPFDVSAILEDNSGRYHTTLHHCDCHFFHTFQHPCTHMVRLALEVGGAMCFAPSDEDPGSVKHAKYTPWGNKVWTPIQKKPSL